MRENVRVTFLRLRGSQSPSAENLLESKAPDVGEGYSKLSVTYTEKMNYFDWMTSG